MIYSISPSSSYPLGNISQRTLDIIEDVDKEINKSVTGLYEKNKHIVSVIEFFGNEIYPKIQGILKSESKKVLLERGLCKEQDEEIVPYEDEFYKALQNIEEDAELNPIEAAVCNYLNMHFSDTLLKKVSGSLLEEWNASKKVFKHKDDLRYPFADIHGNSRQVRSISLKSEANPNSGNVYESKDVKPFIRNENAKSGARVSSNEKLDCRIIEIEDIQKRVDAGLIKEIKEEKALIGQYGVFAKVDIPKGTCVGVYGGVIFSKAMLIFSTKEHGINQSYAINISTKLKDKEKNSIAVDGYNSIARINSIFILNENGKAIDQAATGYNAEFVIFDANIADGINANKTEKLDLYACFTLEDIKVGDELRLDYGYSIESINKVINNINFA